jgi:hypothetical protein
MRIPFTHEQFLEVLAACHARLGPGAVLLRRATSVVLVAR